MVELTLVDGSVLFGRVVEVGDPFRFVLVSGVEMTISKENVRTIGEARGMVEGGEYWPEDPNRTRLLFGPTAQTIPQGDGYLYNVDLFCGGAVLEQPTGTPAELRHGTTTPSGIIRGWAAR